MSSSIACYAHTNLKPEPRTTSRSYAQRASHTHAQHLGTHAECHALTPSLAHSMVLSRCCENTNTTHIQHTHGTMGSGTCTLPDPASGAQARSRVIRCGSSHSTSSRSIRCTTCWKFFSAKDCGGDGKGGWRKRSQPQSGGQRGGEREELDSEENNNK